MDINTLYHKFLEHPTISTDTRRIEKGCIYFALKGEKFDGNSFAAMALEKGAAYAVIDNKDYYLNEKTIVVNDVLKTLQELANHHRMKFQIPVLAITGTNGKTTTKELVREVISQKYNVLSTTGNLNNHIGVPLTLLSLTGKHNFAIIEMGANHPYEIEQLCQIAQPDFGLITNIGKAHLEGFGGFNGVIKTKKELYEFLENNNGIIFYNSDNVLLSSLVSPLKIRKESYGAKSGSICTGEILPSDQHLNVAVRFYNSLVFKEQTLEVQTKLVGEYNLENVLAASAIGAYFGVSPETIKYALESYHPDNNRSQLLVTTKNKLIVDCYNANPSSTEAAILNFVKLPDPERFLFLGDMLELGEEAENEHEHILQLTQESHLNAVFIGKIYNSLAHKFGYMSFEDVAQCNNWIMDNPLLNKTILIKGSRGIQLEKLLVNL